MAQASGDDCVELWVWSNGYHSDIGAPADIFSEDHPLRRLYPNARSFLIGWGDEAFYLSDGSNLWLGVDALIPPSPSVLHLAPEARAAKRYFGPNEEHAVGVSREGAAAFVAYVDAALALDGAGAPIRVARGKLPNAVFVRSTSSFHLFNVCNHWMARALRAAGVDINARTPWFAGSLMADLRAADVPACRPDPSRPI